MLWLQRHQQTREVTIGCTEDEVDFATETAEERDNRNTYTMKAMAAVMEQKLQRCGVRRYRRGVGESRMSGSQDVTDLLFSPYFMYMCLYNNAILKLTLDQTETRYA